MSRKDGPKREFKVGEKIRVNLHHGKIEDAVVKAMVEETTGSLDMTRTDAAVPTQHTCPSGRCAR